jgi:hypothetical protein
LSKKKSSEHCRSLYFSELILDVLAALQMVGVQMAVRDQMCHDHDGQGLTPGLSPVSATITVLLWLRSHLYLPAGKCICVVAMATDHDQKGRNAGASLTLGCGVSAPVLLTASFVAPASGRVTGADL